MFDQLLLLCNGQTVYFGGALKSLEYFKRLGFTCPTFLNPGDFLLDILEEGKEKEEVRHLKSSEAEEELEDDMNLGGIPLPGTTEDLLQEALQIKKEVTPEIQKANEEIGETDVTVQSFIQAFANSRENQDLQKHLEELEGGLLGSELDGVEEGRVVSGFSQFRILLRRTWLSTLRDPAVMYVRTITVICIGLLVGVIFFQLEDDISSVGNRINGILFDMCVFSLICLPSISKFIEDRLLFTRERAGGCYRTAAYFWANLLVEIPILVFLVSTYSAVSYWMIGLEPTWQNFLFFHGVVQFAVLVMFTITQIISALAKSVNVALAIYFLALVYSLLLGGFIVSPSDLPQSLSWALYTSYFYYGFSALGVNEFENKEYGEDALEKLGLSDISKYLSFYILMAIFFVLRVITYVLLRFVHSERR